MDLTLPNGGAPHLKIMEGQTATIGLPDGPTFGLIPSFQAGDDRTVVLSISDIKANPSRELGTVKAMVGGDWVASGTTPEFQIRISGVTTQK